MLDHVATTLADVQAHLRTLIKLSTILLGHLIKSNEGLVWFTCKLLCRIVQNRGPGGFDPEKYVCVNRSALGCAFLIVLPAIKLMFCLLRAQVLVVPNGCANTEAHRALVQSRIEWRTHAHGDCRPRQPRRLEWHVGKCAPLSLSHARVTQMFSMDCAE